MASIKYVKELRRWRVWWHITADGQVDKGSRTFRDKPTAENYKTTVEQEAKRRKGAKRLRSIVPLTRTVGEWLDYCGRHYTPRTLDHYKRVINAFLAESGDLYITQVTARLIDAYLTGLAKRQRKNRTLNIHLGVIKSFCRWLAETYDIPNPAAIVRKVREDPPEVHFLSLAEYKLLVKGCKDKYAKQIIRFIANTGLRASEFCDLKWSAYNGRTRSITITGKGRKRRTIGLNQTAGGILKQRGPIVPQNYIFMKKSNRPFDRDYLYRLIADACHGAGINGGPHTLRHFFATQLLLAGVPYAKVAILLGHASVLTTQRHYAHILSSDVRDATGVLDGL